MIRPSHVPNFTGPLEAGSNLPLCEWLTRLDGGLLANRAHLMGRIVYGNSEVTILTIRTDHHKHTLTFNNLRRQETALRRIS